MGYNAQANPNFCWVEPIGLTPYLTLGWASEPLARWDPLVFDPGPLHTSAWFLKSSWFCFTLRLLLLLRFKPDTINDFDWLAVDAKGNRVEKRFWRKRDEKNIFRKGGRGKASSGHDFWDHSLTQNSGRERRPDYYMAPIDGAKLQIQVFIC